MNKQNEALKMAIEFIERHVEADEYDWLIQACKKALAEAEKQEIGEAEIRQMLKDIEYYQKRVEELEQPIIRDWKVTIDERIAKDYEFKEELEQPAQSACEECMGFNKQLADENDSLKSRIAELQRYAKKMVNRPTHPATSWQGLDAVEISNIFISKEVNGDATQFARAIEQALKEKNLDSVSS